MDNQCSSIPLISLYFYPNSLIHFHPSVRDITLPVCPVSLYLATLIFSLFSVIDSIALVVSRQVFQQRERQSPIPIYPSPPPLADMFWICLFTRNNEIFIFDRKFLFEQFFLEKVNIFQNWYHLEANTVTELDKYWLLAIYLVDYEIANFRYFLSLFVDV